MAPNQNLVVAPGEWHNEGGLVDQHYRNKAVDLVEGDSPFNGSKSLVIGKKGFSPFFKSKAREELTGIAMPHSIMCALSLNESYEAACICRLVAIHAKAQPGALADLV